MHLTLTNIGKLIQADIELIGITVVAGENNTGKSTVSKALFAVFNSFYNRKQKIQNEIEHALSDELEDIFVPSLVTRITGRHDSKNKKIWETFQEVLKNISVNKKYYIINKDELSNYLYSMLEKTNSNLDSEKIDFPIDTIISILNVSDEEIFERILQDSLDIAFDNQISNIYLKTERSARIVLTIKSKELISEIQNDCVIKHSGGMELSTETIYIDNPFILNNRIFSDFPFSLVRLDEKDYSSHLIMKLQKGSRRAKSIVQEILTGEKLDTIFGKLNSVSKGFLIHQQEKDSFEYRESNTGVSLSIGNLSAGLKTFVIIKTLLQNGSLEKNGTLILDEPEIHLHPNWQLVLAEILVLLQKEFNMHILINTHSPYFLQAIEVFAKNHKISEKCRYYLAENISDHTSVIEDVTEQTEKIHKKLARPLQDLENLRYAYD